ncbi:transposase-like protein [Catenulispora sp. GAS73]|uniref:transposase n=1 Tax=Catenulispora sp. GAS73 TaxID=3156269 RepID=UPI003512CF57
MEIWNAKDREYAVGTAHAFASECTAKWPKTATKIADGFDQLLALYDYPTEYWIRLRTGNPVESTFATGKHRQRVTKGPCPPAVSIAMAFKLIESVQARRRTVNAPRLVVRIRAGGEFERCRFLERPDGSGGHQQPA